MIKGPCVLQHDEPTRILRQRRDHNTYSPIFGIVFRDVNIVGIQSPLLWRNSTDSSIYDFINKFLKQSGSVTVRERYMYRLRFSPELCQLKIICMIYGPDDDFLYVCRFDSQKCQFVHTGRLPILLHAVPMTYVNESLLILDAKITMMGVQFVGVYLTSDKRCVWYETKLTTGMYDVSLEDLVFD
jgi:hypothetical protein